MLASRPFPTALALPQDYSHSFSVIHSIFTLILGVIQFRYFCYWVMIRDLLPVAVVLSEYPHFSEELSCGFSVGCSLQSVRSNLGSPSYCWDGVDVGQLSIFKAVRWDGLYRCFFEAETVLGQNSPYRRAWERLWVVARFLPFLFLAFLSDTAPFVPVHFVLPLFWSSKYPW